MRDRRRKGGERGKWKIEEKVERDGKERRRKEEKRASQLITFHNLVIIISRYRYCNTTKLQLRLIFVNHNFAWFIYKILLFVNWGPAIDQHTNEKAFSKD